VLKLFGWFRAGLWWVSKLTNSTKTNTNRVLDSNEFGVKRTGPRWWYTVHRMHLVCSINYPHGWKKFFRNFHTWQFTAVCSEKFAGHQDCYFVFIVLFNKVLQGTKERIVPALLCSHTQQFAGSFKPANKSITANIQTDMENEFCVNEELHINKFCENCTLETMRRTMSPSRNQIMKNTIQNGRTTKNILARTIFLYDTQ